MTLQEMEKLADHGHAAAHRRQYQGSAAVLGIDRSTLYEKIKKYEIPR